MTTFETVVAVESMPTTLAASVTPGRALIVAVAGWPSLIDAASPSLKPATTCRLARRVIVMKLELDELELLEDASPVPLDDEARPCRSMRPRRIPSRRR